ncbi:hypothetical protein GCM10027570_05670 [Streptomonospora sediminis]
MQPSGVGGDDPGQCSGSRGDAYVVAALPERDHQIDISLPHHGITLGPGGGGRSGNRAMEGSGSGQGRR